jgi:hypothetical protein
LQPSPKKVATFFATLSATLQRCLSAYFQVQNHYNKPIQTAM